MMKPIKILTALICISVLAFAQTTPIAPPLPTIPEWVAPTARLKAKTPFAPKPTTGNNIFKGEGEKWLSDAMIKLEAGILQPIKDKEVSDYVTKVGMNLVAYSADPKLHYEFVVLDVEEENAMCIGAGRVYINLGMLKAVQNEDELAGIIGHEIGHNVFGHLPKTVTRQLFWMKGITKIKTAAEAESSLDALNEAYQKNEFSAFGEALLGFSRNDELQADKAGFYNMYKAGYNPEFLKSYFKRDVARSKEDLGEDYDSMQFLIFLLGSHPPSGQRLTALKWESNWIKMPPKDEQYKNTAFDAMKARVSKM